MGLMPLDGVVLKGLDAGLELYLGNPMKGLG